MNDEPKIPLPQSLQEIVGSLLFASETPLTATELRDAVRAVEAAEGENKEIVDVYRTCTSREIDQALRGIEKALEVAASGFRLVCTGGTYRLQTVPSCGRYVRAMLKLDRPSRLGRASLETLAIVAYRQPITKAEIESIRGVDVTANIKTLSDLQLVRLVGKSELPGHPFLYGTTPFFLEHFGLASLQQLNDLDPTLQRSNPRKKAEEYKKKTDEKPAEGEAAPDGAPAADAAPADAERRSESAAEETEAADAAEAEETVQDAKVDGDDIFIDDTPDEYDEEDDDDDDGDADDDEDEEQDEDDVEDEEDDDDEDDEEDEE